MIHSSKTLLRAGILSAFALFAPGAPAAIVAEYNFSTDTVTEGWTATSTSSLTTSGGYLTGTATGNDPQLLNSPVSLTVGAGETWNTLVFRVREVDSASGLFIGAAGAPTFNTTGLIVQFNGISPITVFSSAVASGDDFYTITADISGFAPTTITAIRVDPIGGAFSNSGSETNGNSFEVDFIRISDTAAVPEPGSALLGGLGLLALLRRRR